MDKYPSKGDMNGFKSHTRQLFVLYFGNLQTISPMVGRHSSKVKVLIRFQHCYPNSFLDMDELNKSNN